MANIDVKLSAAVADKVYNAAFADGRSIGNMIEVFGVAGTAAAQSAATGASWSINGSTLEIDFGNGARLQYTGVTIPDITAQRGTAHATGMSYYQGGALSMSQSGQYDVGYTLVNNVLNLVSVTGTTSGGSVATDVAQGSSAYDPTLGNIRISFDSRLYTEANGNSSGDITHVHVAADKLVRSTDIDGSLHFTGNLGQIGQQQADPVLTGTLTGYRTDYQDGSHEYVSGALRVDAGATIDSIMFDPTELAGDDVLTFDLPASLTKVVLLDAGAGNDRITVAGGGDKLRVNGGSGNDWINATNGPGSHVIDGGEGTDTFVAYGKASDFKIEATAQGITVRSTQNPDSVQQLHNVERLDVGGDRLAFDVNGAAGQAYRLYRAAFDREPDQGGLSFWIKSLDVGVSLNQVAADFIRSDEFVRLYGSAPGDKAFLTSLYQNVLHRAPDDGGYAFWLDGLTHGVTRASVLQQFSESPENQAQVNEVFVTGVKYDPNPF